MNKAGRIKKLLIKSVSVKEIAEQVKCTPEKHNWINPPTANHLQVGGTHYKTQDIQPWDAIRSWKLCFFAGNAVKYIARHKSKGGVEDLRKARHYLDKLIELQVK